jgi:hypothetical protein
MILHADTIWLRLKTGAEVRALVRADAIPRRTRCSRFQLLPGAGHMLIDYQATDVKNSIAQFLSP